MIDRIYNTSLFYSLSLKRPPWMYSVSLVPSRDTSSRWIHLKDSLFSVSSFFFSSRKVPFPYGTRLRGSTLTRTTQAPWSPSYHVGPGPLVGFLHVLSLPSLVWLYTNFVVCPCHCKEKTVERPRHTSCLTFVRYHFDTSGQSSNTVKRFTSHFHRSRYFTLQQPEI